MSKSLLMSLIIAASSPTMASDGQIKINGLLLDTTCTVVRSKSTALITDSCRESVAGKVSFDRSVVGLPNAAMDGDFKEYQQNRKIQTFERITVTYF